ncbi:AI-2E family transporter [Demequina sp. NBRC 110055]|uniref:AI-2E family transporter n=1 Tax=Demequina sp. NBRC 110055 TaxID=1570344 RepID=UPI000A075C9F|nr:AI-2E family transporter [Demequina sp. NBRC 110055]
MVDTEHSSSVPRDDVLRRVPLGLRVGAAWSWRLIVLGIVLVAFFYIFTTLSTLFVPLIIALLIAAPLERVVHHMERWHIPRGLGALLSILALLGIVSFLLGAASTSIVSGFGDLRDAAIEGFQTFTDWLATGPLHMSQEQLDGYVEQVQGFATDNVSGLASGALGAASTIGGVVAGMVIALFALFFFLRDGRKLWLWTARIAPGNATDRVDNAGIHAWNTLRRYTQTTVFVAFVDAVGIGLAAWLLGVPLALPIAILVFLFSFIPMFGATLSGAIASLVALVDGGWTTALLMLGAVLLVQQLEGNVLYPWLFGKALSLHPLVVLLTISAGTLTLGLVGAVIAVPIVSFFYAFSRALRDEYKPDEEEVPPITSQVPVFAQRSRQIVQRARGRMGRTSDIAVSGQQPVASSDLPDSSATDTATGSASTVDEEELPPSTGQIRVRRSEGRDDDNHVGDDSDSDERGETDPGR